MLPRSSFRKGACFLTLTGCTTSPQAKFEWRIYQDDLVHLSMASSATSTDLTATSNATTFTLTGLPSDISPTTDVVVANTIATNAGTGIFALMYISPGSSTIRFDTWAVSGTLLVNNPNGWTNSGTKGLQTYWQCMYRLRRV